MFTHFMHWASRIVLGGAFLYSGYIKLASPLQFAAALTGYQLFPDSAIVPLTRYFPWAEIALGILLLFGWRLRWVAAGAVALLCVFTLMLTVTYVRGIDAACGCFGFSDRISPLTIARDALLLLPALFLLFQRRK